MIIHSYKIQVLAVALYVFATATAAHAHGTHSCQTKITNNQSAAIRVSTYNSVDSECARPHTKYTINPGETKTVKAHGHGRSYCKIRIKRPDGTRMCKNHSCGTKRITKTAGIKTSLTVQGTGSCSGL